MQRQSYYSVLLLLVLLALAGLSSTLIEARRSTGGLVGRHYERTRSASWSELQNELQGELEQGLDESTLNQLEQSVVSQEGATCMLQQPRRCDTSMPVKVVMDISIDDGTAGSHASTGRIVLELFNATAPRTVANFLTICDGRRRGFSYKGNRFHRIITGFMAQGGDITRGDGRGGKSIYGTTFRDETFACHHVCRGALAMANAGRDTNGSQFFITFAATPWLDGKHVVFGQLADGWQTLAAMEQVGSESGQPNAAVTIERCQVL